MGQCSQQLAKVLRRGDFLRASSVFEGLIPMVAVCLLNLLSTAYWKRLRLCHTTNLLAVERVLKMLRAEHFCAWSCNFLQGDMHLF